MKRRILHILFAVFVGSVVGAGLIYLATYEPTGSRKIVDGHALSWWLRATDSDDPAIRASAVKTMPQFGLDAVGPLIELLDQEHRETAQAASDALASIGSAAVPKLTESLRHGSTAKRIAVISLLQNLGGASAPASEEMAKLLGDLELGSAAAEYFVKVGVSPAAIAAAADILDHGESARRLDAVRVLRHAGNDSRAVAALVGALKGSDNAVRDAAFLALCDLTPAPQELVPEMIARLQKVETRFAAKAALKQMGPEATKPLRTLTTHPVADVRASAVDILASDIQSDPTIIETLAAFLEDPDPLVIAAADKALRSQVNTPAVHGLLNSPQPKIRVWAIHAMREVRPAPMQELSALLDDPDREARDAAAEEIRLTPGIDDPNFMLGAKSGEIEKRIFSIRMLPFIHNLEKFDVMIAQMDDAEPAIRCAAVGALWQSINSQRASTRLVEAVRHDNSAQVRAAAARALADARVDGVDGALADASHDPDAAVSDAANASMRYRGTHPSRD